MSRKLVSMVVSLGCGSFALKVLNQSVLNVWVSRAIGLGVVLVVLYLMYKFYVGPSQEA